MKTFNLTSTARTISRIARGSRREQLMTLKGKPLTPTETKVGKMLVEGLSNKLIADGLGISSSTAKFHVEQITRKLGVDNRTQAAVHLALQDYKCSCKNKESHGTTKA